MIIDAPCIYYTLSEMRFVAVKFESAIFLIFASNNYRETSFVDGNYGETSSVDENYRETSSVDEDCATCTRSS